MKTTISETIDGSMKDIIQLKTLDSSLEYSQLFDALDDCPQDFKAKLIGALNSLGQTMGIPATDVFNQVLCASEDENAKKKLYNWWKAVFEVVSKSVPNIPEDRRQEYEEKLDALISEICKAGDKASGNDVVLEDYEPADIEEEDKLKEDMTFAASKIGEVAKKAEELVNFLNPYCGTEVNESTMDETEVRDFVKAIGFRPDSDGIDYETQLVDALTGKDTSYNAGWGAVYYNSDKVLQFLKKFGLLGSRGIKQKEAISKLKRLFKSGKWKDLDNEVDSTMKKIDERGGSDWVSMDDMIGMEVGESDEEPINGDDEKKIAIANAKKTAKKDGYDQYILFDKSDNSWAFERKHIQTKDDFAKFGQEVVGIVRAEDLKFVPFALESDDGGKAFWNAMDKVDDLEKKGYWKGIFKVGDKVSWIDPEYDEITSGWTVVSAPDEKDAEELLPEEMMYTIENDDGSEAEVLGSELRPALDNLLGGNAEDLMISDMEGDDEDEIEIELESETEPLDEYEFLDKMLEDAEDTNDVFDVYDGNVIEDGTVALNVTVYKDDVEDGEVEAEFKDMPLKYGWEYEEFRYSSDVPGEEGTESIVVYFRPQKKRINEMSEIQDAEDFKDSLMSLTDDMFETYDANTKEDGTVEVNVVAHKESVSYGEVEKYFAPIAKKYGWKFVSFGYSGDMVDSIVEDGNCAIVVSFKKAEEKLDESDLENELAKGDDGWREIGQPIGEATVTIDANDVWDVLDLLNDETANKNLTNLINSHVRTEEEIMDAIDTACGVEAVTKEELNKMMSKNFFWIVDVLGLDGEQFKKDGSFVDPEKPVALESDDDLLKVGDKVKVVGKGLASKGWVGEISSVDKAKKGLPYTVTFADRDPGEYAKDEVELVQEKDETPPDEVKDGEKKYKQDGETKTLDFGENKKPVCEMTIEQEVTDPWKLLELLWGQGKENFEELLRSNLFSDDRVMDTLEQFEVKNLTNLNDLLAYDFEQVLDAFGCDVEAWTQHLEIQKA